MEKNRDQVCIVKNLLRYQGRWPVQLGKTHNPPHSMGKYCLQNNGQKVMDFSHKRIKGLPGLSLQSLEDIRESRQKVVAVSLMKVFGED
jgi:hypothetical protein